MNDNSAESTCQSISQNSSVKNYKTDLRQKVAIFDWDDTLFSTSYIQNMNLNLNDIFSFKISFEDNFGYLTTEFQELQNVSCILIF